MGNRFSTLWGSSQALKLILAFTCLGLVLVFSGDCGPDRDFDYSNFSDEGGSCIDNDGDGYGEHCKLGPDCDDTIANVWSDCSDCVDSEGDSWGVGTSCDNNEDCDDADENNWVSCAICLDGDSDGYYAGCDAYTSIDGPDCDDADRFSYPGAPELGCNSKDNNCDGNIDEVEEVVFADANLETLVKPLLGLTPGATVYNDDFCGITIIALILSDIYYLDGLEYAVDLVFLSLMSNEISDISALAGLTALSELYLSFNQISDISALAGLTALSELYLSFNQVSDLQPLVDNGGIGAGDIVYVNDNPLDSESCCTDIPTLTSRGVDVDYDPSCNDYPGCPP